MQTTLTMGSAEVQHRYLGPPDPLHPTADITITLSVFDDDGDSVTDEIEVGNPGIETTKVAIDTTPDVPRLDLSQPPMIEVFIARARRPGTSAANAGPPRRRRRDRRPRRNATSSCASSTPTAPKSDGYRIKDEALADLRAFFKTLPDGRYIDLPGPHRKQFASGW